MLFVVAVIFVLLLIYAPTYWIKHVMKKYGEDLPSIPGSGGELAIHLVERFRLVGVQVEQTTYGDHYDPRDTTVRLTSDNYEGKSLTAIAIAAHEVGHAIQYHRQESITRLRERLTPVARVIEKLAMGTLIAAPLIAVLLKTPHVAVITAVAGLIGMLAAVAVQFVILPLEWDASFNKALPILVDGEYISEEQVPAVRSILKAAAFTYVAGTLASLLSVGRWLVILKSGIR